jgi:adenylate cyclase
MRFPQPQRALITRIYNRLQFGSALGLCVGCVLFFAILADAGGTRFARLSDFFYQPLQPSGQVVIVAIDDASIQQIGPLPWNSATLAQLIDTLADAQPSVIAFDMTASSVGGDATRLHQSLRRAGRIILPIIGVDVTRSPATSGVFPHYNTVYTPYPLPPALGTQIGHINITPDPDGIVRHIAVAIESNGQLYPALGIAALLLAQNQTVDWRVANNQVQLGEVGLPINHQGQMQLNFFGPNSLRQISAIDVLNARVKPDDLRAKIVLIGVTGASQAVHYATPVSSGVDVSNIQLQADLIETIVGQHLVVSQGRLTQIVMVFLLALLAGATLPHFRILPALGLTIIYFLLYIGYAFAEFGFGIIVQPIYPVAALLMMFIGTMAYRYFSEVRHREFLIELMRRYLAPDAVDRAAERFDLDSLPMRGIRRQVSVLAIDLSELEPLASSLTAPAMIALLNEYADLMLKIIFQHEGSVVKQTGSAILAAWNLLLDQPDHAPTAVRAAIEIRHAVAEFNSHQPKELTIRTGMGIATGNVIAGRLGTSPHAEYTIIGEIVGMAERIALKPERGVFIDVTTRERLGDEFDMLEVKPVRLRRQTDPSQVWLLVEAAESTDQVVESPVSETIQ